MKRLITLGLVLAVSALGSIALTACGEDSERTRIPKSRLKPMKSIEEMTPEERAAVQVRREDLLAAVMTWPDGAGEAPDVRVDYRACQVELEEKRSVAKANALVKMSWLGRCMAQKGWVVDPEAELPQG